MTLAELENVVGSLSQTTKIPAPGFSTSAFDCKMGSILAKINGSICHDCYARHGNNLWANAQKGFKKRSLAVKEPYWTSFMTELISRDQQRRKSKKSPTGHFRWFNSGDLESLEHLEKIVEIAKNLPHIKFWLPTREYGMVKLFKVSGKKFPPNLCVRLSALMIDQKAPRLFGLPGSGVVYDRKKSNCRAYKGGEKANCGSCRMCWDKKVKAVYYPWHKGRKVGK